MASTALPRADDPKMVKSPASMVHASSSYAYACAEDGYFKRPHMTRAVSQSHLMTLARWGFSRELPHEMRILMRLHETKPHEISLMRSRYY